MIPSIQVSSADVNIGVGNERPFWSLRSAAQVGVSEQVFDGSAGIEAGHSERRSQSSRVLAPATLAS
jgi:hypothetical protein